MSGGSADGHERNSASLPPAGGKQNKRKRAPGLGRGREIQIEEVTSTSSKWNRDTPRRVPQRPTIAASRSLPRLAAKEAWRAS